MTERMIVQHPHDGSGVSDFEIIDRRFRHQLTGGQIARPDVRGEARSNAATEGNDQCNFARGILRYSSRPDQVERSSGKS